MVAAGSLRGSAALSSTMVAHEIVEHGAHMSTLLRHLAEVVERESSARVGLTTALRKLLDEPARGVEAALLALTSSCPAIDSGGVLCFRAEGWTARAAIGLCVGPGSLDDELLRDGPLAHAALGRVLLASTFTETAPAPAPFPSGTRAACVAPLTGRDGRLLGLALFGSRSVLELGQDELLLARIAAERSACALEAELLAAELEQARSAAARTSGFRDQVLAIVGHDLRNPLGAIVMSTALLQKRGGLSGWQAKAIDRVRGSATRVGRIIDDLLSYTRTRLGDGIPIARAPCDLGPLVNKIADELRAGHPDATLDIRAEGDLCGEWDAARLEQVLSNVVSNGIDHGEVGRPIEVVLRGSPDAILVLVTSHGEMPRDALEHAFEAFRRGPEQSGRKASGLGLGLYIAREIVRRHGGEIAIHCQHGTTRIELHLPRR